MKNPEFWVKELVTVEWKDKTLSFHRAVHLSLGVSKNVDPLSGMTVNLMDVRALFAKIREQLSEQSFTSYADVLKQAAIAVQQDVLANVFVGLRAEGPDGFWRMSQAGVIEEQKTLRLLVDIDGEILEGEISLWKKPADEIQAEISHPTNLEELARIPGAELFVEAKEKRWFFL